MFRKPQILTIVLGCLLAIVMMSAQLFQFQVSHTAKKEAKTEQQSKTSSEDLHISMPSFSLPTSIHVEVNLDPHCLFEILFEEESETDFTSDVQENTGKLFNTLFRLIISPNAP